MVSYCCVITCLNTNDARNAHRVKMHRFPRNDKLAFEWVRRIGNPSLIGKDKKKLYRSYRVCDIYFSNECRMPGLSRGRNLKVGSIPTLALPTCIIGPAVISPYPPCKSEAASDNGENIDAVCGTPFRDGDAERSALLDNVKKELCRICGNKEHSLTPIFGDNFMTKTLSLPLPKVLELHLPLQLRADDHFPSNICSKCLSTLSVWHELYIACAAADKAFKSALCKEEVQNSEILSPKLLDRECVSSIDLCTEEVHEHVKGNFKIEDDECGYTENNFESEEGDNCYERNNFESKEENHEFFVSEINANGTELLQSNFAPRVNCIKKYHGKISYENYKQKELKVTECQHLSESADECIKQNYIKIVFGEGKEGESPDKNALKKENFYLECYLGRFSCKYCHELFKDKHLQKLHHKICQNTTIMCELCGKSVLRKYLCKHKYRKHAMQIVCEKCGLCVRKSHLYKRMKSAHSDTKYCELCCSVLRSSLSHSLHMKNHTSGKLKSTFSFNSVLLDGKEVYICSVCDQSFDDKMAIVIHLNEPKLMECSTCPIRIKSEKKFILHKCKRWNCQFCTKKFYRRSLWKDHERIHTGVKPYKCGECNINFRTMNQKTTHVRNHRPPTHECKYCCKKFHLRCKLIYHIQCVHEGQRFTCEVCDNKFTTEFSLKTHFQKHFLHKTKGP